MEPIAWNRARKTTATASAVALAVAGALAVAFPPVAIVLPVLGKTTLAALLGALGTALGGVAAGTPGHGPVGK